MREIPEAAVAFVAAHEALRPESYQDQGGAWSIGYGHTGAEVHAGLRWTEAQCQAALASDLKTAAARLGSVVKREVIDDLTPNQYSALVSFVFNLGCDPGWTIWKRLNARQYDQVPPELMRFVYVGKTKLQGLVNRRAAEVALWSTAEPGSVPDEPPSSYTRAEATPPVTADPVPVHKQPGFITACGAAVCAGVTKAPDLINTAVAKVTPFADKSHVAQTVLEALGTAGMVAALGVPVVLWFKSKQAKQ